MKINTLFKKNQYLTTKCLVKNLKERGFTLKQIRRFIGRIFPRAQVLSLKVEHDFFTFNAINLSKFLYLY